nr:hypothetical protein [Acidobacteriota bacterium]
MKRWLFLSGTTLLLLLFSARDAYATCQKCQNPDSPEAMCWTIGPCENGATMGACVVKQMPNGNLTCDSVGSSPGPECNGNDSSCSDGGGGGGGWGGGGWGGWSTCYIDFGDTCPADCSKCEFYDGIPPEYN